MAVKLKIKGALNLAVKKLVANIEKIPDEVWRSTPEGKHRVIWLINRQKPSVEQGYNFDEERFGLTQKGAIIWGFDSG